MNMNIAINKGWRVLRLCVAGSIFLFLSSCGKSKQKESVSKPPSLGTNNISMVSGFGRIEPLKDMIQLSSEVDGIVIRKIAQEGDTLVQGDTIIVLNHAEQRYKVRQLEAQVETQRLTIRSVNAQVNSAETAYINKKQYYERLKKAYENEAESGQNVDDARLAYNQASSKVKELKDQLLSGQSRMHELQAELGQARVDLSRRFIRALTDGTILNMNINQGSYVKAYQSFGDFAPSGPLAVKAEVDELFAQKLRLGQKAKISLYAQQDTVATGKIVYLAPALSKKSIFSDQPSDFEDRRVRKVTIALFTHKPVLIGSRVNALIQISQ